MGTNARQGRGALRFGRALFVAAAVLVFVSDRVTKVLAQRHLATDHVRPIAGGIVELVRVHNHGIAYGWLSGAGAIVVLGSIVVGLLLLWFLTRVDPRDLITVLGGACITGGALGNLVDRVMYGYVVDFLHIPRINLFRVFNVADVAISLGVVLIIIGLLRDGSNAAESAR